MSDGHQVATCVILAQPRTGRTHQIRYGSDYNKCLCSNMPSLSGKFIRLCRVHATSLGLPIVNDDFYDGALSDDSKLAAITTSTTSPSSPSPLSPSAQIRDIHLVCYRLIFRHPFLSTPSIAAEITSTATTTSNVDSKSSASTHPSTPAADVPAEEGTIVAVELPSSLAPPWCLPYLTLPPIAPHVRLLPFNPPLSDR
jgi:hypothetical protein